MAASAEGELSAGASPPARLCPLGFPATLHPAPLHLPEFPPPLTPNVTFSTKPLQPPLHDPQPYLYRSHSNSHLPPQTAVKYTCPTSPGGAEPWGSVPWESPTRSSHTQSALTGQVNGQCRVPLWPLVGLAVPTQGPVGISVPYGEHQLVWL